MKFINVNYKENKSIALQKLEEYYAEQHPGIDSNEQPTNYECETYKPVSIILQNDDFVLGRIFGLIDLITYSLKIEGLIVEKESRGTGAGRMLVEQIEKIAIEEGCRMSFVDTTSSSAPKFYEKQGYSLIGEINDYPMPNETYYFYMKRLR